MRVLQFLSVVLTALAFVPYGAHLFELPNKIALSQEHYFIVQAVYRGWALFGIVIVAAIGANFALGVLLIRRRKLFWPALAAGLFLAGTLVVFFEWTYPANQTTESWTLVPAQWKKLRAQWEFSHAANAVLSFIAFCCAILSAITSRD